jgi:osmotically-inducible protein OsmY
MARVSFLLAAVVALSAACRANTATQEPVQETRATSAASVEAPATVAVPENPVDRGIRRDLNIAIAQDAALKNRDISFIVTNGDVNVTGTVQTEDERKKINDLAMNIDGVKSVANGLRVAE